MTIVNAQFVVCLIIFLRLVTYQRNGSVYKPVISLFAYVLIVASGGEAILCLFSKAHDVSLTQLVMSCCICYMTISHNGNVARCLSSRKVTQKKSQGTTHSLVEYGNKNAEAGNNGSA